jgi:hypothetical protein
MTRPAALCTFILALACYAGQVSAEPIVFITSDRNLEHAKVACEFVLAREPDAAKTMRELANNRYGLEPSDWVADILAGALECKSVRDTRELGRRLENELTDAIAVNSKCAGVTVIRDPGPEANRNIKDQQAYWDLLLNYNPGKKIFGWILDPVGPGGKLTAGQVNGEGTVSKAADQICIVVTGRGAIIR